MREPVFLRGNVWWCYVTNPAGGRRLPKTTRCRDRKAAVSVWRELERQSVAPPDQAKNETTLGDALDRLLEHREALDRADGTLDMYTKKARQLNRVLGSETPLSRLSAPMMLAYVKQRRAEGSKTNNIGKELATLGTTLKLVRQDPKCKTPSWDEIRPLGFSADYEPKTRRESIAGIERLADALDPKRSPLFYFLCATGATYPSEVSPMQKGDVDKKRWMVRLRGTKRKTRFRMVPIVSFARPWLEKAMAGLPFAPWSNIRRDLHVACAWLSTCDACRRKGRKKPPQDDKHSTVSCARCEKQRFAPLSPNDLRRTIGGLMRAAGVEPALIGEFLGHIDSRMAERVYGKLKPEELAHLLDQRITAGAAKFRSTARLQRSA